MLEVRQLDNRTAFGASFQDRPSIDKGPIGTSAPTTQTTTHAPGSVRPSKEIREAHPSRTTSDRQSLRENIPRDSSSIGHPPTQYGESTAGINQSQYGNNGISFNADSNRIRAPFFGEGLISKLNSLFSPSTQTRETPVRFDPVSISDLHTLKIPLSLIDPAHRAFISPGIDSSAGGALSSLLKLGAEKLGLDLIQLLPRSLDGAQHLRMSPEVVSDIEIQTKGQITQTEEQKLNPQVEKSPIGEKSRKYHNSTEDYSLPIYDYERSARRDLKGTRSKQLSIFEKVIRWIGELIQRNQPWRS